MKTETLVIGVALVVGGFLLYNAIATSNQNAVLQNQAASLGYGGLSPQVSAGVDYTQQMLQAFGQSL